MFKRSFLFLILLGMLLFPVGAAFAQDDEETPELAQPEAVELKQGESAIVPPSSEPTVVKAEQADYLQGLIENPEALVLLLLAAIGLLVLIDKVTGGRLVTHLEPIQPILSATRDTLGNPLYEAVKKTPSEIDDELFRILANKLGYKIVEDDGSPETPPVG